MTSVDDLERHADIESARLGVAEELAWPIGMLAAYAAHLEWHIGWWSVLVAVALYFLIRYPYVRREKRAEDAYHRAAELGKYAPPPSDSDAA